MIHFFACALSPILVVRAVMEWLASYGGLCYRHGGVGAYPGNSCRGMRGVVVMPALVKMVLMCSLGIFFCPDGAYVNILYCFICFLCFIVCYLVFILCLYFVYFFECCWASGFMGCEHVL